MEKRTVSVRAVPDFKKLHQKWDQRMKCTRQCKPTTVAKEFSLGRQKQENNDEYIPVTTKQEIPSKNTRTRPPCASNNPKSTKRLVLDGRQKENQSPGKRVRPAILQKQQGIEFEEDKRALNRILSTANENVPSSATSASHRQTFAFGSNTPQAAQEPVRMSIYSSSRPRPLAQIQKATTMALSSNVRRATTLGVKAERNLNKTPAPPVVAQLQRQSIYMRSDVKTPRSVSKQVGTPAKVAKPKTPATMTAKRIPTVSKPPVSAAVCAGQNVKWADVLTPNKAVQDPLKRALFMEESSTPPPIKEEQKTSNHSTPNTSQDFLSPRLSLTDADLRKFQEIEEREKKLLEEISQMSRQQKSNKDEKMSTSPSKENIDLCAASFQKAADNFVLQHKNSSQKDHSFTSEFSLGPSPDRDSLGALKKGGNNLGHSPLSDVDSAVDMASVHNLTIDELSMSLSCSQTQFEHLQSEFRTLQSGCHGDGDIMRKLQQIETQQRLVLRQQQDLHKQMTEQQKQLQEQQKLMTAQKQSQASAMHFTENQNEAITLCVTGANRRFSTSENSPFALFNQCRSLQKDVFEESKIQVPTTVKLSPAVILTQGSNAPIRTPLAMAEKTRPQINQTPNRYFPSCGDVENTNTPMQSVQSAFKSTRMMNSEAGKDRDSFEFGSGLLNMTPYTAATTKVRTQLLAKTILTATSKKFHNALLDEEVGLYMTGGRKAKEERFDMCCRLVNPVAMTLMEGDEMHFIPIVDDSMVNSYTPEGSAFSSFIR